jgi:hypothetical protein
MLSTLIGVILIAVALHDAFEVMVLPRRVRRRLRLARFFYRTSWRVWKNLCRLVPQGKHRQDMLSVFAPLSLFGLFTSWAVMLICGFALVHWGLATLPADAGSGFATYLYLSGQTFFTLGYGDKTPVTPIGRFLSVVEAGTGFGFMAVTIGYLPVLYQAFSGRERNIALLDTDRHAGRALSPACRADVRNGAPHLCRFVSRVLAPAG